MASTTRRLRLRASIEESRARGLETLALMRQLEMAQAERRIDSIAAAGQQADLDRAFRAAALAHPSTDQTR